MAATSAATLTYATPNVLAGCSSTSRCSPFRVRLVNPGLHIRLTVPLDSHLLLHARKNVPTRHSKFVFASSVEDVAPVEATVGDGDKASETTTSTKTTTAEDPDGGIPSSQAEEKSKELEEQTEKSKELLEEAIEKLKDVTKIQDATKQAYTESAEKALGALRDTTEQLKEQAEKARAVLLATAQDTASKGKENLSMLAENSPDPLLKDIAETALNAHSSEKSKQGAKIHDFCLGIPYGSILLGGGLVWFLLTGSTGAIRFGIFLGGLVLAMSVNSLKVWKRGESSMTFILGQGAVAAILFIRDARRFSEVKKVFPHAVMALLSAFMLGFYAYVYLSGGNPPKKVKASETL